MNSSGNFLDRGVWYPAQLQAAGEALERVVRIAGLTAGEVAPLVLALVARDERPDVDAVVETLLRNLKPSPSAQIRREPCER
jgi:hypothetical protein